MTVLLAADKVHAYSMNAGPFACCAGTCWVAAYRDVKLELEEAVFLPLQHPYL